MNGDVSGVDDSERIPLHNSLVLQSLSLGQCFEAANVTQSCCTRSIVPRSAEDTGSETRTDSWGKARCCAYGHLVTLSLRENFSSTGPHQVVFDCGLPTLATPCCDTKTSYPDQEILDISRSTTSFMLKE